MDDYQALLILKEAKRRFEPPVGVRPFPPQDEFVADESEFLAACCTRRAGKSNGLARRFKITMDRYPGALNRYISLTRDSAKDIMWPVLQEMDATFKWGMRFTESNLTMTNPQTDAKLRLYGADMRNFVRRLRGAKSPGNAIDEAQEFAPDHLMNIVDDIITPSMADFTHHWLALTGTPGAIPRGLFFDVTEKGMGGYSVHKWSLYDNPYMPNPRGFVARLKAKRRWDDLNPTLLREYYGQWVLDLNALLLPYLASINDYAELPPSHWYYILGIDIGLRDADALAVLAWSEEDPNVYLVDEIITSGQDLTALQKDIQDVMSKYEISRIVMDTGGLGAKIAQEFTLRKGIPVEAADKTRKFENAALLKDEMRAGRFRAKHGSRFARDCELVQIDYDRTTPDRLVLKPGFHSDIIDAVLYAFKEAMAFTYRTPQSKIEVGSEAWARAEVKRMEEAAMEEVEAEDPWWAR